MKMRTYVDIITVTICMILSRTVTCYTVDRKYSHYWCFDITGYLDNLEYIFLIYYLKLHVTSSVIFVNVITELVSYIITLSALHVVAQYTIIIRCKEQGQYSRRNRDV